MIVLVDAAGFEAAIAIAPHLAEAQVACADLLVLNKIDLADCAFLDAWHARRAAPDSRIVETIDARVPLNILFSGETTPKRIVSTLACGPVHEQATSGVWRSGGGVDLRQLQAVLAGEPTDIYRAKGIERDAASGRLLVVHLVGSRFSLTPVPYPRPILRRKRHRADRLWRAAELPARPCTVGRLCGRKRSCLKRPRPETLR